MKTEEIQLIAAVVAALNQSQKKADPEIAGQHIVVLDRGFVYVGNVRINGDFLHITDAKNVRHWGTKNGLGELRNGPLKETKLDEIGDVIAPMRALIHLVPCKGF